MQKSSIALYARIVNTSSGKAEGFMNVMLFLMASRMRYGEAIMIIRSLILEITGSNLSTFEII
jgi:hypothetical protein